MCPHLPPCPDASAPDREAAHTIACHPEQGWSLLCNGVVIFEDTGELLPNGATIAPHRPTDHHSAGRLGPARNDTRERAQPAGDGNADRRRMLRQGVRFPGKDDHTRHLVRFRDAEGVPFPVDHKHASPGTAQLGVPGLARLPGRVQRERQRDHAGRADLARGPAGHPGPVRPAALHQRHGAPRRAVSRRSTPMSSAQAASCFTADPGARAPLTR